MRCLQGLQQGGDESLDPARLAHFPSQLTPGYQENPSQNRVSNLSSWQDSGYVCLVIKRWD